RQPVGQVVVVGHVGDAGLGGGARVAQLAGGRLVVEAVLDDHQQHVTAGVVLVLRLRQDNVARQGARIRPGRIAAAVSGEALDRPAGPVILHLADEAARQARLDDLAAVVVPGVARQGVGGDTAGALIDAEDLGLVDALLVVVAGRAPRPQQAGGRL